MKKLLFYLTALTMAVGCTDMVDEVAVEPSSPTNETVFATFNLEIEGGEAETRVAVDTESGATWKVSWEDGDEICVYSLDNNTSTTLTYVADGNSGGTFSGDVYPGKNRITYSNLGVTRYHDDIGYFELYGNPEAPAMISSDVINISTVDEDGDGVVNETIDVTMKQLSAAIDLKMTFTGIPNGMGDLSITQIIIGQSPSDEYISLYAKYYMYADKTVDDENFLYDMNMSSVPSGMGCTNSSNLINNNTTLSQKFYISPTTLASGKKLQVKLIFSNLYELSFDFTNNSGADFEFKRATHSYLEKNYDLSAIASAFDNTWAADAVPFADQSAGTESDPIEIASEAELAYLAKISSGLISGVSTKERYYKLTADLNIAGKEWYPIGTESAKFEGHFDGGEHTISNLTQTLCDRENILSYTTKGLFGSASGSNISNLKMKDPNIICIGDDCGSICGVIDSGTINNCSVEGGSIKIAGSNVGGITGIGVGSITNCYNKSCTVEGYSKVGGVVGALYNDSEDSIINALSNCYNKGNIIGSSNDIGGVAGYAYNYTIMGCYNTGSVTSTGSSFTGGCFGTVNTCTVSKCYNTGIITGKNYTGGCFGSICNSSTVTECYNRGNVSGASSSGGCAGQILWTSKMVACYNTGDVSGSSNIGGCTGVIINSTATSCYNTGEVTATNLFGGCIGRVTNATTSSLYYISAVADNGYNEYGVQVADVAALNDKVAEMNTAAKEVTGATEDYFTVNTGNILPSLMGEKIEYGSASTSSDPIEGFTDNGGLSDN